MLSSFLDDCCHDAARIIMLHAKMLIDVDTPPPAIMQVGLQAGLVESIAKGLMSVTEQDIISWRNTASMELHDDEKLKSQLYNDITQVGNVVDVPSVHINRENRFIPDRQGIMELVPDMHDVDFTQAWIGGFTIHMRDHPLTESIFIEGRDILISAAVLSIEEIVIMMKNKMRKLIQTL